MTSEDVTFEKTSNRYSGILESLMPAYSDDMAYGTDIYILDEFVERDDTPEAALKQIDDMQYSLPFSANSRKLFKIGVAFDSQKRILNGWKAHGQ